MIDNDSADADLERFIRDWHWDKKSHRYARELGAFLFGFLDELKASGLSPKTLRKHRDNCWLIGSFECRSGWDYEERFAPEDLFELPEPAHEAEFVRKVSDSESALESYRSTWRKLYRYARSRAGS
jgi:hypothetical protein